MPQLRARNRDILIIARAFAEQIARRYGLTGVVFSRDAEEVMLRYPWPGNIREMKYLLERVILLNGGGKLDSTMLALTAMEPASLLETKSDLGDMTLHSAEKMLIEQALERANGNVSKAARDLGVTRMVLRYRMKKYNLC
jgi:Transcriptional regulator containing GAF, AAA-type ATPase, and DNA binding domains